MKSKEGHTPDRHVRRRLVTRNKNIQDKSIKKDKELIFKIHT